MFDTLKADTATSSPPTHSYSAGLEGVSVRLATKFVIQGDAFSVQLNEHAFLERLALCKHSLIVRVVLSNG